MTYVLILFISEKTQISRVTFEAARIETDRSFFRLLAIIVSATKFVNCDIHTYIYTCMHTIGVHDCIQYSNCSTSVAVHSICESLFIVYNKMNVRSHKKFLIDIMTVHKKYNLSSE